MKIICTQKEQLEMKNIIAIANRCICPPHFPKEGDCENCIMSRIEWQTENGDRLIEYGDNPTV